MKASLDSVLVPVSYTRSTMYAIRVVALTLIALQPELKKKTVKGTDEGLTKARILFILYKFCLGTSQLVCITHHTSKSM